MNKQAKAARFELRGVAEGKLVFTVAMPTIVLAALQDQRIPVFVEFPLGALPAGRNASIQVRMDGQLVGTLHAPLLAPR